MNWLSSKIARRILIGLLTCAALFSVLRGAQNGYHASQDFQWTGARMLLDHIDPWRDALDGDPLHRIVLTQNPNYLPLLYIFLAPLAALQRIPAQLVWIICNILFAIVSALIAARFYRMSRFATAVTLCIFLTCTPTRMSIGLGQQSLFVLLFWSLGLLTPRLTNNRSAITGIAFVKYSFAPPLVIYLWLRAGIRAVLYSLLPAALGTLLIWLWLTGGRSIHALAWLTAAPFKLAGTGYFPYGGGSNLMDVLELPLYAAHLPRTIVDALTFAVALAICIAALSRLTRSSASLQCHMALLSVLSFSLFKHHTYDGIVLLFAFCYLARLHRHRDARIALVLLAYIWYAERLVDQLLPRIMPWTFIPQFFMLMVVAAFIFRLRRAETDLFLPSTAPPTATPTGA